MADGNLSRLHRRVGWLLAVTMGLATSALYVVGHFTLARTELVSGPTLFLLILFLACYGLGRRIWSISVSSALFWTRLHIVVGIASIGLFGIHVRFRYPNGGLELTLATLYVVVALSGVVGWWLARQVRTARFGELRSEQDTEDAIRLLGSRAEEIVERVAAETGATTLADFYLETLASRFDLPPSPGATLLFRRSGQRYLQREVARRCRAASAREPERQALVELATLLRARDDLDDEIATRWASRAWLVVHVPLTFVLLCAAILHGIVARAFLLGGGN